MAEDVAPSGTPQGEPQDQITERKHESLFAVHKFPGEADAAPPSPSVATQSQTFRRVVLPLAAFIGLIVVMTWVSQYLPSWRAPDAKSPTTATGKTTIIFYQVVPLSDPKSPDEPTIELARADKYAHVPALWEPRFKDYVVEFEADNTGFYDYVFVNETDQPADMGLERQSCACSKIQICLLPAAKAKDHARKKHQQAIWNKLPAEAEEAGYDWKELPVDTALGVTVAPGQGGLLRLTWNGDRVKERKDLDFTVWTQPQGQDRERRPYILTAAVVPVPPVQFLPAKLLDMGDIVAGGSAEREFWCWSSTRHAGFDIDFPDNPLNPCIQCKAEPLSKAECATLTARLMASDTRSRAWSGYKVLVTVKEKAGTKQLDMGLLFKQVAMNARLGSLMEPVATPYLRAVVAGDVRVGNSKAIALDLETFSAKAGVTNRKFKLFTEKGVKLKYLSAQPAQLDARLKELGDQGADKKETGWEVTLTVPGNTFNGPLENTFLLFESTPAAGATRQIRIPLTGTAKTNTGPF